LFLISSPFHPYFILNFWSPGGPPLGHQCSLFIRARPTSCFLRVDPHAPAPRSCCQPGPTLSGPRRSPAQKESHRPRAPWLGRGRDTARLSGPGPTVELRRVAPSLPEPPSVASTPPPPPHHFKSVPPPSLAEFVPAPLLLSAPTVPPVTPSLLRPRPSKHASHPRWRPSRRSPQRVFNHRCHRFPPPRCDPPIRHHFLIWSPPHLPRPPS
jgi:hypothetical protein